MDKISTADGIMWLFWGAILVMSLLLIFSCTIWVDSRTIYLISYVGLMILVILMISSKLDHLRFLYKLRKKIDIIQSTIAVLDTICVIISIVNHKKRKIVSNILINFATILSVVNFIMLQKILWH